VNNVHFSSQSNEWATPTDLFRILDRKFNFTLDPCATPQNAKCKKFFTQQEDGLAQTWAGETVFMNPPYGREIGTWIRKAYEESTQGATVVCLIPARTDTTYWHDYVMQYADEIWLKRGRVKFGGSKNSAPFPSAVVVFRPGSHRCMLRAF
jgi:site-specific DNA-methyltransferase (adenine-specific)